MMESSPLNLRRVVIWIGRLLLGGIFVYAGVAKIILPNMHLWPMFVLKFSIATNLTTFAQQVESYKILSARASDFVAHTLPFTEIVLGLLLLIGWRLRMWATLVTLILLGFVGAVTRAYLLHMQIDCGCFGVPEPLTGMTVLRDSLLALLAVVMTILAFLEARGPHPWSEPEKVSP
ncbi:MAG TPA: MauE/DoxX family redox-associated membrane protein [Candidatus Acidoferrum sp.]